MFFKKKSFSVAPFGGDIRPSVTSPAEFINGLSRKSGIIIFFLVASLVFMLLTTLFAAVVTSKVSGSLYVSDGTPFGCEVGKLVQSESKQ